jgi:hypothetical protein
MTASDGTYQIGNLPPGFYTVEFDPTCGSAVTSMDAPRLYPAAVQVTAGGSATGIDAVLAAAASISGTVTDAADPAGLAGVCVTAISAGGGIGFATAVTAADGTYTLAGLPGDSYTVEFDPSCDGINPSADLAQSTAHPVVLPAGGTLTGIDAVLGSGGAISGTVTDAASPGGVAGVCVTALSADGGAGSGTATTASDGSYGIANLPPDSYTVEFDPTCGGSITSVDAPRSTAEPVAVAAGTTTSGVNALLAEYGLIVGQVTDPAHPGGVLGVCVLATASNGGGTGSATTNSSGSYTISQLPPGSYTVQFDPSCAGTVSTLDLFQATASPVTVSPGASSTVDAALSAVGAVSGAVTDAANPGGLPGVCVSVASASSASGTAMTSANGTYVVAGLPSGTYAVTFDPTCGGRVASADTPRTISSALVTAGSYTQVNAVLSSAGAIGGKVTDHAHPAGLTGVCVSATSSDGGSGFGTATTGAGGRYAISGLPPDGYLVVFDPTCGGVRVSTDILQVAAKPVAVQAARTTGNVNAALATAVGAKFTADSPRAQAALNMPYSYTFKATGRPSASFTISSGQLPAGLTLNPVSGTLSGKPTKKGAFSFRVTASNGYGKPAVTPLLTIKVAAAARAKFTADAPARTATVGISYRYRFTASGFPAPAFTVASGHLPDGMSLNSVTGVLSGKPTRAGTFTFTITASNGATASVRTPALTIVVRKPGS